MKPSTYAVIMAGGRGTRFWPLSRRTRAKQFLQIATGRTLIQNTVTRIEPLIARDRILVVLGEDQREEAARQLVGIPRENFIVEPVGRNTAPAIGLASLVVSEKDPEAVMVVLPADHVIRDEEDFRGVLRAGASVAARSETLVILGIRPTRAETGYGYIQPGEKWGVEAGHEFRRVTRFAEKPSREVVQRYVEEGNLWNSGMFIWRTSTIRRQIGRYLPALDLALKTIWEAPRGSDRDRVLAETYPDLDAISIDYGVMEKSGEVVVIPCEFGWNDVGSWSSLASIWKKDASGNAIQGEVIALDSKDCIVSSDQRIVALIDLEGLIVISTPDAVLVCPAASDQKIRDLVNLLEASSLDRYL